MDSLNAPATWCRMDETTVEVIIVAVTSRRRSVCCAPVQFVAVNAFRNDSAKCLHSPGLHVFETHHRRSDGTDTSFKKAKPLSETGTSIANGWCSPQVSFGNNERFLFQRTIIMLNNSAILKFETTLFKQFLYHTCTRNVGFELHFN